MPRARVFVSHSTKEERTPAEAAAREVLEALERALSASADRYHLLLDRIALRPGDAWRARINLWVGACDAAVVLLSEAALESAYVAYETSVLAYRRTLDPGLRVIPVLVPPVTPERLERSRLAPQQLAELQLVAGSTPEVVARVLAELETVSYSVSPVERRAHRLARLLKKAHDQDVDDAYEAVGLDVGPWLGESDDQRWLRLAVQLMSVGMEAATRAVLLLQQDMGADPEDVREMVDIIAAAWVDHRSSSRLPLIARGQEGRRAVCVNALSADTARMYARCARIQANDARGSWYLAPSNGVAGERVVDELEGEIRRSLAGELGISLDRLNAELRDLFGHQPVLVALPDHGGITREVLNGLRDRLPWVTFFVLAGELPGRGALLRDAEVEFLVPELGDGDEAALLEEYGRFQSRVRTARLRGASAQL